MYLKDYIVDLLPVCCAWMEASMDGVLLASLHFETILFSSAFDAGKAKTFWCQKYFPRKSAYML